MGPLEVWAPAVAGAVGPLNQPRQQLQQTYRLSSLSISTSFARESIKAPVTFLTWQARHTRGASRALHKLMVI